MFRPLVRSATGVSARLPSPGLWAGVTAPARWRSTRAPYMRYPLDSLCTYTLPLQEQAVQRAFVNSHGSLRIGKLLELIDGFAALASMKHADGTEATVHDILDPALADLLRQYDGTPRRPNPWDPAFNASSATEAEPDPRAPDAEDEKAIVVTAAVDRLVLNPTNRVQITHPLGLRGIVTWSGRSSMEVMVDVTDEVTGARILRSFFVMVARDPQTGRAFKVPRVVPQTDEEKRWGREAERRQDARKQRKSLSLTQMPPTSEEGEVIHTLFRKYQPLLAGEAQLAATEAAGLILMSKTQFSSTQWTHPQNKNIHGKLYGGTLIREAYELAYITAKSMCGKDDPMLIGMDDISFIHPVEIGCVVEYRSSVQYCTNDYEVGVDHLLDQPIRDGFPILAVRVQADVLNLESGERKTTNVFHFTFRSENNRRQCLPVTYSETLGFLNARRRISFESDAHKYDQRAMGTASRP